MATSDGASNLAFISIDSPTPQGEYRTLLSLPDAAFRRILLAEAASKLRGEEAMAATATAVRIRHDLHTRLLDARAQTDELFRIVRDEAIYDRPIPERHRIIFYLGHVEAFDWNLLAQRAFGLQHRCNARLTTFLRSESTPWEEDCRATGRRLAEARRSGGLQPSTAE